MHRVRSGAGAVAVVGLGLLLSGAPGVLGSAVAVLAVATTLLGGATFILLCLLDRGEGAR